MCILYCCELISNDDDDDGDEKAFVYTEHILHIILVSFFFLLLFSMKWSHTLNDMLDVHFGLLATMVIERK